jgi:hypothetical protein
VKPDPNDRWLVRRRLIFAAVGFGALMIIAGGIGLFGDKFTGELVYGGVTIITGAISAYAGFATYDDKWHSGGSPDG